MTALSFTLPHQSFLFNTLQRCHYVDRCQEAFSDRDDSLQLTDAVQLFFSKKPYWLQPLVGFLGFKLPFTGLPEERTWWYDHKARQLISFPLQLFSYAENEIVLGEDGKHLAIRISFFLEKHPKYPKRKQLTITTMVQFNNGWGRLYFLFIKPLHKLVVPALLRGAVCTIEKNLAHEQTKKMEST